jgi:hypothetical protein
MADDDLFNSEFFNNVEERLRDEARGLIADAPTAPLVADLRNTFVRRRRRRRIVQTCGAAAAVLVGLAGVRWLSMVGGSAPHDREKETPPVATAGAEGQSPRPEPSNRPRDPIVIHVAQGSQAPRPGMVAIGVLIARPLPDGKTELVPGLFVPEQTEPIDSREWSSAERLAVSRLLGSEANLSKNRTI